MSDRENLMDQIGALGLEGASELEVRLDELEKERRAQRARAAEEAAVREMYEDLLSEHGLDNVKVALQEFEGERRTEPAALELAVEDGGGISSRVWAALSDLVYLPMRRRKCAVLEDLSTQIKNLRDTFDSKYATANKERFPPSDEFFGDLSKALERLGYENDRRFWGAKIRKRRDSNLIDVFKINRQAKEGKFFDYFTATSEGEIKSLLKAHKPRDTSANMKTIAVGSAIAGAVGAYVGYHFSGMDLFEPGVHQVLPIFSYFTSALLTGSLMMMIDKWNKDNSHTRYERPLNRQYNYSNAFFEGAVIGLSFLSVGGLIAGNLAPEFTFDLLNGLKDYSLALSSGAGAAAIGAIGTSILGQIVDRSHTAITKNSYNRAKNNHKSDSWRLKQALKPAKLFEYD